MNEPKFIIAMRPPKAGYFKCLDVSRGVLNTVDSMDAAFIFSSLEDAQKELMNLIRFLGVGSAYIREL